MDDWAVRRTARIGQYTVSYAECGPAEGPPLVMVHGLASDSDTWDQVARPLAERGLRVIALDLLGHGRSDKPRDRYLLDDFARQLLAFLDAVGLDRVTVCGHSLGGAIAMHFAYHYPQRVRRLALVSAGGLGVEVHLGLRGATLSIAPLALAVAMSAPMMWVYRRHALHRVLGLTPDQRTNLARIGRALGDDERRSVFFAALRGVITLRGQRGPHVLTERLSVDCPTIVFWSEGDIVIPVAHAHRVQARLPGARLVVFPGGGHEPHRRHAASFAEALAEFVAET